MAICVGNSLVIAQKPDWIAPSYSNSLKNLFEGNPAATATGKMIFNQICVLYSGLQGKGNGKAGLSLERKPSNLRALKVINQTDGNIFWEITNRKSPTATNEELSRIFF